MCTRLLMITHLAMLIILGWVPPSTCATLNFCSVNCCVLRAFKVKSTFLPRFLLSPIVPATSFDVDMSCLPVLLCEDVKSHTNKTPRLGRQGPKKKQQEGRDHGTRSRSRTLRKDRAAPNDDEPVDDDCKRKALSSPPSVAHDLRVKKVRFRDTDLTEVGVLIQLQGLQVSPSTHVAVSQPPLPNLTDDTSAIPMFTEESTAIDTTHIELENVESPNPSSSPMESVTTGSLIEQLKGIEKYFIVQEVTELHAPTAALETYRAIHTSETDEIEVPNNSDTAKADSLTAPQSAVVVEMDTEPDDGNCSKTETDTQDDTPNIYTDTENTPPTHAAPPSAGREETETVGMEDSPSVASLLQSQDSSSEETEMDDKVDLPSLPHLTEAVPRAHSPPTSPSRQHSTPVDPNPSTTGTMTPASDITDSTVPRLSPLSQQDTRSLPTIPPPKLLPPIAKTDQAEGLAANYVEPPGLAESQIIPYNMIKSLVTKIAGLSNISDGYPGIESMLTIFGQGNHYDARLRNDINTLFLAPRDFPPHPSHAIFKTLQHWSKACQTSFLLRNPIIMSHLQVYHCAASTLRAAMIQSHKHFCDKEIQQLPALYELLKDEFPRLQHPGLTAGAVYGRSHNNFVNRMGKQFRLIKEDLFLLAKLFPAFEFCPTPPGATVQQLHNHLRYLCDESIILSEDGLKVTLPTPELDPDNFSAEARRLRRSNVPSTSLMVASGKTWSEVATGKQTAAPQPRAASTTASETQLQEVRVLLQSTSDVSGAYETPPINTFSLQQKTLIELKADLGERFVVTNMVLIDRFPISKVLATAIRARRLSEGQQAHIVQAAREAITQLGFPTRKHITSPPKNDLDIDEPYLRTVIFDSLIPDTVVGCYSLAV